MTRETVQDPVCGMTFTMEQAAKALEWQGRTFHFCCEACLQAFQEDPQRYVQPKKEPNR